MESTSPLSSLSILFLVIVIASTVIYVRSIIEWKARAQGLPLPPGPAPLPFVGNVNRLPTFKAWLGFRDLSKEYGGLMYLQVFGQGLLVISDSKVASEFFEKHSANSFDRPTSPVLQLSGQDLNFGLFSYGSYWRRHRREFWQFFHPGVVYDIDADDEEDERIRMPHAALEAVRLATPGRFAVETFPILRYVPSWFPGAGFQKIFAECKIANDYLKHVLFNQTKSSINRGESPSCVVANMLNRAAKGAPVDTMTKKDEEILKNVCATAMFSVLQALFAAMVLYPDVQEKAQAELDAVVGRDRLPDFDDRDELVYISTMVKEAIRWNVVTPLGIPHMTMQDDEFHGYFIPGGTTVLPNAWAMLHDPEVYESPDEFRPERFIRDGKLDPTVQDPAAFAFGFGRRICAGRYFAFGTMFISIASILHVFDISPPLDKDGVPLPRKKFEQTHGVLSYPEDCRCTIKPRSAAAEALIREAQVPSEV
ncbi:CyP450 monooxygenase [Lenzites betulinus]|nr:CyP450 monooxygenase [Lenzites betulinus]